MLSPARRVTESERVKVSIKKVETEPFCFENLMEVDLAVVQVGKLCYEAIEKSCQEVRSSLTSHKSKISFQNFLFFFVSSQGCIKAKLDREHIDRQYKY